VQVVPEELPAMERMATIPFSTPSPQLAVVAVASARQTTVLLVVPVVAVHPV
jgi:hypothetical protein